MGPGQAAAGAPGNDPPPGGSPGKEPAGAPEMPGLDDPELDGELDLLFSRRARIFPCRKCVRRIIIGDDADIECTDQTNSGSRCSHCAQHNHTCPAIPSEALAAAREWAIARDKFRHRYIETENRIALLETMERLGRRFIQALTTCGPAPVARSKEFAAQWSAHRQAEEELKPYLRRFGAKEKPPATGGIGAAPGAFDGVMKKITSLSKTVSKSADAMKALDSRVANVERAQRLIMQRLDNALGHLGTLVSRREGVPPAEYAIAPTVVIHDHPPADEQASRQSSPLSEPPASGGVGCWGGKKEGQECGPN